MTENSTGAMTRIVTRALSAPARGLSALYGRRALRRWTHLVLGGALSMPYYLVGSVVLVSLGTEIGGPAFLGPPHVLALMAGLPLAAVTALFPPTRPLSVTAVRALCGIGDGTELADGPARSGAARGRTAVWFTLHLAVGAVTSGTTLAVVPFASVVLLLPVFPGLRTGPLGELYRGGGAWALVLSPLAGAAMLLLLAGCVALAGALLARAAPALLGPAPADRLAEAERRAADLAVRGRLARELHDSVGHALSAVTLQAVAARKVLDTDPGFVREALAAIEETTRRTVGELDAVLGVLRDTGERGTTAPPPTLETDLDGLLRRTRAGGALIDTTLDPGPHGFGALPPQVSREAYRIVQEALSNALRHAGAGVRVDLTVTVADGNLDITAHNPLPRPADTAPRPGGGHGLRGIADRARLLGGRTESGAREDRWLLRVRLPLRAPR
ncbi:sensor histidine kinase [Streptomyces uncialis]|uniref:sensor histidine kinase n=1 Tax=Streptomyces uncialis TaxID=1048205 RepID=UPI0036663396